MSVLRYITHPEVAVDPGVAVTTWGLRPEGVQRARALCGQPWVARISRIISSNEVKAVQAAEVVAGHLGLPVEVREGIGENDRSATGYVPAERFEQLADRFFAEPHRSVEGWERAIDAQARVVRGLSDVLDGDADGDVAVLGHGGVGTLLWCALSDQAIDRRHDQPGQGHYFSFDLVTRVPLHPWRPIDELEVPPT